MSYAISDRCTGCTACVPLCPEGAITAWGQRFRIVRELCLECAGSFEEPQCAAICPVEEALLDSGGHPVHPPGSLTGIPVSLLERHNIFSGNRIDVLGYLHRQRLLPLPVAKDKPLYHMLRPHQVAHPNAELFSRMLESWWAGVGAMPDYLGLEPGEFHQLTARFYPSLALPDPARGELPPSARRLELNELVEFLRGHAMLEESVWLAQVVAAGCLGNDHLWHDMGLWSRGDLGLLLHLNFPSLAAKNTRDMKWKKFIYRQMCENEGVRACRSPSCAVCGDYAACFGPED